MAHLTKDRPPHSLTTLRTRSHIQSDRPGSWGGIATTPLPRRGSWAVSYNSAGPRLQLTAVRPHHRLINYLALCLPGKSEDTAPVPPSLVLVTGVVMSAVRPLT